MCLSPRCWASYLRISTLGFAPIAEMIEAGINVALGTDGMAPNNNHDMFQDMYLMAMLPKGNRLNPELVTPKQAFAAATRNGAIAQGRTDCGLIRCGFKADLAVLNVSGPSWSPMTDPLCNLVYAGHGSDVVLTMCDGKVIYDNGIWPTIDLAKAEEEVAARHARIVAALAADSAIAK